MNDSGTPPRDPLDEDPMSPESLSPEQAILTARFITGAMASGVIIFMVIVGVMYQTQRAPMNPDPQLRIILFAIGVVLSLMGFLAGPVIRGQIWNRARRNQLESPTGGAILTGSIVATAVNEAAALFGLVGALAFGPEFLILAVASLVAMVLLLPRKSQVVPDANPYRGDLS
ncbi:MAG: hypothetical protein ACF8PN_14130 [Phycisphaerales bacterium]